MNMLLMIPLVLQPAHLFPDPFYICFKQTLFMFGTTVYGQHLCRVLMWIVSWIKSAAWSNYANPLYGVPIICHQVRCLRWGHPHLFHTATSLFISYKRFCMRDISYWLIWMKFISMLSVYMQSGMHRCFNWWIIAVLTSNPSVLMCVEISDAHKPGRNM